MNFDIELSKLLDLYNNNQVDEFKVQYETMKQNFPNEKEIISKALKETIDMQMEKSDREMEELTLKVKLYKVSQIVSLSYIAKHYFNKSRSWLYQRINNNMVQGKPAKFTDEELKKLQFAIKDISRELDNFSLSSSINY